MTREVALTGLVHYRSIDEPASHWAEEIMQNSQKALVRESMQEVIAGKGFDVKRQAIEMEQFYITGQNPPGFITKV